MNFDIVGSITIFGSFFFGCKHQYKRPQMSRLHVQSSGYLRLHIFIVYIQKIAKWYPDIPILYVFTQSANLYLTKPDT